MAYTFLTYKLQSSAHQQVTAANNQNALARQQLQNSFFLPIVVLALTKDTRLAVENIGFGPAVNIRDIVISGHDTNLLLYHAAYLRSGQMEPVGAYEGHDVAASAAHKTIDNKDLEGELKRLFPEVSDWPGKHVCVAYSDANNEWHRTRQSIWFSRAPELSGMAGLVLRFESIENVGKDESACRKE